MVFITEKSSFKKIGITEYAKLSLNPLTKLTFESKVLPNPDKKAISLQLGDPTAFGNFPAPKELIDAFRNAVDHDTFSYNPNAGRFDARAAVAKYSKDRGNISADDIVLTSGCNHALELCVWTLTKPGENILIPSPCYTYRPITEGSGIITKYYKLDPFKDWEIDLERLESLIDDKTRAIIVNHPGNPCGQVFTKKHILDILAIAERHVLPIISDEVYEFMVFPGVEFHPIASLSKNVPVLTCSGLTKRFCVPGIRMGWIIINDCNGALVDVKEGLRNCTGRIYGPNSTVQYALPEILRNTPQKYFDDTMKVISRQASTAFNLLKTAPGLQPIMPKGSIYMMIQVELEKFSDFSTCLEFSEGLIREQSVFLFPGVPCFNFPGFIRIVLTLPVDLIKESCARITEFCENHVKY